MAELRLIEQAQQGDPAAIAALMNQSLQQKGMTAFVERQGDALEVTLQADRVPNRQALTAFVEKGIHNLGIASIRSIRIMGQQTGTDFPAWMQELYLEASSADPSSEIASASSLIDPTLDDLTGDSTNDSTNDRIIDDINDSTSIDDSTLQLTQNLNAAPIAAEPDANLEADLETLWNEQSQSQSEDFLQELMQSESEGAALWSGSSERASVDPAGEPADFDALQNLFGNELSADTANDLGLSDPDFSDLDLMGDAAEMPNDPPASAVPDPWTELTQPAFQPDADRSDALTESTLEDSGSDALSDALLDDLFADTPTDPVTTDEMGFESAAVSLTSVDDLLSVLDGEPDASTAAPEPSIDAGQFDPGQFDLDQQMADQLAADLDFESDQPQGSHLGLDDADASLSGEFDLFSAEETLAEEVSEPVEASEPTIAEEFLFADASQTDEENSLFGSRSFDGFDETLDETASAEMASDEIMFAMATEPLDVENLEFSLSESESLDANLVDESLFLGELSLESAESVESAELLDEMTADSEMPPEVALQDQWIESSSNAADEDFGLDNLALVDFASEEVPDTSASESLLFEESLFEESESDELVSDELVSDELLSDELLSEQDVFAQEFPASSETLDFPADLFAEPAADPAADEAIAAGLVVDDFTIVPSSSSEENLTEPLADPLMDATAEDDHTEVSDLDERLDLSGWFDNQIESGDPAAELSTAPSEDFLTSEDMPGFTPEADLLAFTPESESAELESAEPEFEPEFEPELNSPEAVADFSFENVGVASDEEPVTETPPEITQQQLEAQIANLFAEEDASATETGFQNSWELQSDDVSDDSADNEDWSNALAFHLNEPAAEPAAEPVAEPALTFEGETAEEAIAFGNSEATAEPSLPEDEFQDLSFLTDMPGIDLPDDQLTPASTESQFDEFPEETIADDPDLSLANTLSLSEAMHPDELQSDLQADLQTDLQDDFQMEFSEEQPQDDFTNLDATDAPASLEELSDEQLQDLLGDQSEESLESSAPQIFASGTFASGTFTSEASADESIVAFETESAFQAESTNPEQEPLVDYLNRQFGLEEEMPTVEELPEPVADEMTLEPEFMTSAEPDTAGNVQPTEIPFAAAPFAAGMAGMAASSMASSPEVPFEQPDNNEPDLSLDLSEEWGQGSDTQTSVDLAAETPVAGTDVPGSPDAFAAVPPADSVPYPPTETYPAETYPADTVVDPQPVGAVSAPASRPASSGNGIFTIILFSIVGFIAALLGFSLWSQISAPPEPETPAPAPPEPPASPAAPPAAPPAQTAPPAAPPAPVPPAAPEASPIAPPAAVPPAPAPAAPPVDPLAPIAPPAPAPEAPPASPSPAV